MKTKIKKFFKNFTKRENISALGLIVVVAGVSLVLAFAAGSFSRWRNLQDAKVKRHSAYEDELRQLSGLSTNLTPVPNPTADWKDYSSARYGFSLKYPAGWQPPQEISPGKDENFIQKISFDEKGIVSDKITVQGFDVFIYSASRFPGPAGTDNLKKKNENVSSENCPRFEDITLGQVGYPAKEVNVTADNPCWEETFFYSLTVNGYTFNIVPRTPKGFASLGRDIKIPLVNVFPEFYDVASTLTFAERQSAVSQAPRRIAEQIASPPAVRYTAGQRCAVKNDHPSYSKTKGKHMDEDCCPDPDEWPNPKCAYSGGQLGVLRAKPKK